jgi:hypothetical protein
MPEEEWLERCAADADDEPVLDEDEYLESLDWDPAEVIAESDQAAADEAAAAAHIAGLGETAAMAAAGARRRGPGQEGSASVAAGVFPGPGGGFASGHVLDTAPGGGVLLCLTEQAAGPDDRFAGTSDDELTGIITAADRSEASASALKHAAVAELIRRRPAPGFQPEGDRSMPAAWDEFTERELASALGESRAAMEHLLGAAHALEVKLPGTRALFRSGVISSRKAQIIAAACDPLDPQEARAAEQLVLGRAGRLTPGSLRAAIARAVMEVNAAAARKRRETARKQARVQRWAEDSGNAALEGRELPVAETDAMDRRISWWARQLKKAGLAGSWDELRARAFTDLLLGADSRLGPEASPFPPGPPTDSPGAGGPGAGRPGAGGPGAGGSGSGGAGGFAARTNLTVPAATLLGLAGRPGELGALGPIDPWLARDLATAAARNPASTWCITVTDTDGHAIGHGCARPEPKNQRRPGHDPPPGGTGFSLTPGTPAGPPGGYGTWRLRTPGGSPDLIIELHSITTNPCDHQFENRGHDPGVRLRHLTQIRYTRCTAPACRRPATACDYEHNTPYETGGRTCLCNGNPKCRHDHRLKQHPHWNADQQPDGTIRWTTPSGRTYTTEPTRYPT